MYLFGWEYLFALMKWNDDEVKSVLKRLGKVKRT